MRIQLRPPDRQRGLKVARIAQVMDKDHVRVMLWMGRNRGPKWAKPRKQPIHRCDVLRPAEPRELLTGDAFRP